MFRSRLLKWLFRILGAILALAIIVPSLLLAFLWAEHNRELTLPAPTGHFPVGRATFAWVNNAATDELAPTAGTKREVVVWIWYPAAKSSAPPAEYLPAVWRTALDEYSGALMSKFFTRDLSRVQIHSMADPELSAEQLSYPVVILRAGGGALTTDFTVLAEDLASNGYVVVGFDAPYRTSVVVLPDQRVLTRSPSANPEDKTSDEANRIINRLLPMWTGDTSFVVNQLQKLSADSSSKFASHLDLQRLGMVGHSFGGATALQFCHDDIRCKAGIDLDGAPYGSVVQDGLKQPFMFLLSDHSREMADPEGRQVLANIESIYNRLPDGRYLMTIRGAHHFTFSDQAVLKSPLLIGILSHVAGLGKLDSRRGLTITTDYVHTFFDVYLKGDAPDLLMNLARQYPEIEALSTGSQ